MTSSLYVLRQLFNTAQMYPQKVAVVLNDQAWTYSELIEQVERVANYLHRLDIVQGQIIYQFVERSFEMVCGLLSIMCIGGVYCPLNPTDPHERLTSLVEQTQGQFVLVHAKTRGQFPVTAVVQQLIQLDVVLSPLLAAEEDIDKFPDCNEYGVAYVICTSGTTGQQKAVVHTHKSFASSTAAFVQWNAGIYTIRDQILQVAACSWVLHLTEISLPLVTGGTLVLLQPGGHLNMDYFCQTLVNQQITTLTIGPGIIRALTDYLDMTQRFETFMCVHNLCVAGKDELLIYF